MKIRNKTNTKIKPNIEVIIGITLCSVNDNTNKMK